MRRPARRKKGSKSLESKAEVNPEMIEMSSGSEDEESLEQDGISAVSVFETSFLVSLPFLFINSIICHLKVKEWFSGSAEKQLCSPCLPVCRRCQCN